MRMKIPVMGDEPDAIDMTRETIPTNPMTIPPNMRNTFWFFKGGSFLLSLLIRAIQYIAPAGVSGKYVEIVVKQNQHFVVESEE